MPTDIASLLVRKAQAEADAFKDRLALLLVLCLWTTFGLVVTALAFENGFDPAILQTLAMAG